MSDIYHCDGECSGSSRKPGNCGAKDCDKCGEPLTRYTQCADCVTATEEDDRAHWCEGCETP